MERRVDVSVLIPIYGVEKYIARSLRSIFSQSKTTGVEYILVNDCTLDRSMEIARELISEFAHLSVKVIEHKRNCGLAVARQSALNVASGEYILPFDSDDWCEPTMIEDMYALAVERSADIVVSDFYYTTPLGDEYVAQPCPSHGTACAHKILSAKLYSYLWCKLFRRELFTKNNISWEAGLNMWEDTLICSKVFPYADRVAYLPKAYIHYIQIWNSISNSLYNRGKIESLIAIVENIEEFYRERGVFLEYREDLVQMKIRLKLDILYNSSRTDQRHFLYLFPEVTDSIPTASSIPALYRAPLLAACGGSTFRLNLIRLTKRIKSSIFGKKKAKF